MLLTCRCRRSAAAAHRCLSGACAGTAASALLPVAAGPAEDLKGRHDLPGVLCGSWGDSGADSVITPAVLMAMLLLLVAAAGEQAQVSVDADLCCLVRLRWAADERLGLSAQLGLLTASAHRT